MLTKKSKTLKNKNLLFLMIKNIGLPIYIFATMQCRYAQCNRRQQTMPTVHKPRCVLADLYLSIKKIRTDRRTEPQTQHAQETW